MEVQQPTKAEQFYKRHLERLRKYNQEHADVIRARAREHFKKIKEDPDKYKLYLEKKRLRYKELNPKQVLPVKEFE
jgi:vacuolar-type H+-ATPase subunit H